MVEQDNVEVAVANSAEHPPPAPRVYVSPPGSYYGLSAEEKKTFARQLVDHVRETRQEPPAPDSPAT